MTELTSINMIEELVQVSKESNVIIFKHSTSCGISFSALEELKKFMETASASQHKIYYLDLLAYRPISNALANTLKVPHASPQAIILKNGVVTKTGSHYTLNVDWFDKWSN